MEWKDNGDGALENDFNIQNALWFGIGSFLCQGCDILPKWVPPRLWARRPTGPWVDWNSRPLRPWVDWNSRPLRHARATALYTPFIVSNKIYTAEYSGLSQCGGSHYRPKHLVGRTGRVHKFKKQQNKITWYISWILSFRLQLEQIYVPSAREWLNWIYVQTCASCLLCSWRLEGPSRKCQNQK